MLLNNEKTQKLLKVPFLIMRTVIFHTISLSLFRYFAQRVCVCVCTLFLLYFPFGEIKNLLAENVYPLCLASSYSLFSNELWTFALFLR